MTHQELLTVLQYEPKTGVFTRRVRCGRMPAGSVVGSRHSEGYVEARVLGERWLLHRLAVFYMTGAAPPEELDVDHKNRVRSENWWLNLRVGTKSFNGQNRSLEGQVNNHAGHLGVSFHPQSGLWRARAEVEGKEKTSYHSEQDAAKQAAIAVRIRFFPGFVSDQRLTAPSVS